MRSSTRCPSNEQLSRLLIDALSDSEQGELAAHLDSCPNCRRELERLASGEEGWKETARKLGSAAGREPESALRDLLAELRGDVAGDGTQALPEPSGDDTLSFLAPPSEPGNLGRLAHYEVMEIVGRGGMGVVLKAFDSNLHRIVALKVMTPALASSASARQRFLREARAAAAVRNDHVIDIHHVGEENGLPYLVMELIAGRSLQERIDQTGPMQLKEILRIGFQTACGLAAAHAQGLIHRDIKPANILLENGVERVKITDFGLARAVDDASLTQSGVVTGTPQYMAPEQARGESVDYRADLFSLGSMLYAMCCGRSPFRANTTMGVLRLVSDGSARPIRQINPDVSERLADIIAKLHAKDPAERFQSAQEVAEALAQHLAEVQQPESGRLAPRVGTSSLRDGTTWRPRRRWAVVAAAVALLFVGLGMTEATGVTKVVPTVIRIVRGEGTLVVEVSDPDIEVSIEGDRDDLVIKGAGLREIRLRPGRYQVRATRDGKPLPTTQELITIARGGRQVVKVSREPADPNFAHLAPGPKVPDFQAEPTAPVTIEPEPLPKLLPGAPLNNLAMVSRPASMPGVHSWTLETVVHRSAVEAMAYDPAGKRLATADRDGVVRIWEPETGRLLRMIVVPVAWLRGLAWSPDGAVLATASEDSVVRLFEVSSGRLLRRLRGPFPVTDVAWSPDGQTLAASGFGSPVRLWEVRTGKMRELLKGHTGDVHALAWSPDGRTLASGSHDHTVRLWAADSGRLLHTLQGHTREVKALAWSPDSRSLASGAYDHTIRVWDVAEAKSRHILTGHTGDVYALAWSPNSDRLASGATDHEVRLWDPATGKKLGTLEGHTHNIAALAWDHGGIILASASWDTTVRLWQPQTGECKRILSGQIPWAFNFAIWSPDGKSVASGGETVRIWETATGRPLLQLRGAARFPRAWSPDSKTLAATNWDGVVRLYHAATGERARELKGHEGKVNAVAWSPDGKRIASAGDDRRVRLWDADNGELRRTLSCPSGVSGLAWSPDSKRFATGEASGNVLVWDEDHQEPLTKMSGHTVKVSALAWSPDGQILASGAEDKTVCLHAADSGKLLNTLRGHSGAVESAAWSPDGKALACAGGFGDIRLWNPATGGLNHKLIGHTTPVLSVRWSPDGKALVSGSEDSTVRFWSARNGRPGVFLMSLPEGRYLAVNPDGHYHADEETTAQLRYVVQTDSGQEMLTREEFARKYHWKNDPEQVRPMEQ